MNDHEQFTLTLQPLQSNIPATVRIRQALKTLLRAYRLRCVRIDGTEDQTAQDGIPITKARSVKQNEQELPAMRIR